jgi:predicted nucleic acid-binding protein
VKIVLDTSYLIEFLNDPELEKFQWIFERKLIAPDILRYEYNNVLLKKFENNPEVINRFRDVIHAMAIEYIDICGREGSIMALAISHHLSFYDASYLAIAVEKQASIATYDKKLIVAATKKELTVIR